MIEKIGSFNINTHLVTAILCRTIRHHFVFQTSGDIRG